MTKYFATAFLAIKDNNYIPGMELRESIELCEELVNKKQARVVVEEEQKKTKKVVKEEE